MTLKEAIELQKRKRNKYGARRTGYGFPSKLEGAVYGVLLMRQRAGEIGEIRRQHVVILSATVRWKIDFSFPILATGETCFAEAKGKWTQDAILKLKLYKEQRAFRLEIWQGSYKRPTLVETVLPKE